MTMKEIVVTVVRDQSFCDSYWTPSGQQLGHEIRRALRTVEQQFPEDIRFRVKFRGVPLWKHALPIMQNFPESILWDLQKGLRPEDLFDLVYGRLQNIGIKVSVSQERREATIRHLTRKSIAYRHGYIHYALADAFDNTLLQNLMKQFPVQTQNNFVLGFSGASIIINESYTHPSGTANKVGGTHVIFPWSPRKNLFKTVVHEVFHLLGAEHTDDLTTSVMHPNGLFDTLLLDAENKNRVLARIANL